MSFDWSNYLHLARDLARADYDDRFSYLSREASLALRFAEDIISDLREL